MTNQLYLWSQVTVQDVGLNRAVVLTPPTDLPTLYGPSDHASEVSVGLCCRFVVLLLCNLIDV